MKQKLKQIYARRKYELFIAKIICNKNEVNLKKKVCESAKKNLNAGKIFICTHFLNINKFLATNIPT